MTRIRSNVEGFVKEIKHSESGLAAIVIVSNGEVHEYGNLSRVAVEEFEIVNVGDLLGFTDKELSYSVN